MYFILITADRRINTSLKVAELWIWGESQTLFYHVMVHLWILKKKICALAELSLQDSSSGHVCLFVAEKERGSGESHRHWQNLVSAVCHLGLEGALQGHHLCPQDSTEDGRGDVPKHTAVILGIGCHRRWHTKYVHIKSPDSFKVFQWLGSSDIRFTLQSTPFYTQYLWFLRNRMSHVS